MVVSSSTRQTCKWDWELCRGSLHALKHNMSGSVSVSLFLYPLLSTYLLISLFSSVSVSLSVSSSFSPCTLLSPSPLLSLSPPHPPHVQAVLWGMFSAFLLSMCEDYGYDPVKGRKWLKLVFASASGAVLIVSTASTWIVWSACMFTCINNALMLYLLVSCSVLRRVPGEL